MEIPSLKILEEIANNCFDKIDFDKNGHIEFEEFLTWFNQNDEFHDFLLKFSGTQSYPNAKRRFGELMVNCEAVFNTVSADKHSARFNDLAKAFDDKFQGIEKNEIDSVWKLIKKSNKKNNIAKNVDNNNEIKEEVIIYYYYYYLYFLFLYLLLLAICYIIFC